MDQEYREPCATFHRWTGNIGSPVPTTTTQHTPYRVWLPLPSHAIASHQLQGPASLRANPKNRPISIVSPIDPCPPTWPRRWNILGCAHKSSVIICNKEEGSQRLPALLYTHRGHPSPVIDLAPQYWIPAQMHCKRQLRRLPHAVPEAFGSLSQRPLAHCSQTETEADFWAHTNSAVTLTVHAAALEQQANGLRVKKRFSTAPLNISQPYQPFHIAIPSSA